MAIKLPKLPYAHDALEPHMSSDTLDYHYGKHHRKYVEEANRLIAGTEFEHMSEEEIIHRSSGAIYNNVAQAWNHSFFWNCLTPDYAAPGRKLSTLLTQEFGSLSDFEDRFTQAAIGNFGSGWTWLVKGSDGTLKIINTQNAGNPLTSDETPLLTCDVWEHAYYLDHYNNRSKYLRHYWSLVNWKFVESGLHANVSAAA